MIGRCSFLNPFPSTTPEIGCKTPPFFATFRSPIVVRSMRASLSFAYISCLLLCFTHQCLSQIGQTKEELIPRYGPCQPNPAGKPEGPNVYDSVIDVGEDCTFQHDQLIITSMFKAGKAVAFDYRVEQTFLDSLSEGKSERYRELWDLEILRLLYIAVPGVRWVVIPSGFDYPPLADA
jgi:hypothetical protein